MENDTTTPMSSGAELLAAEKEAKICKTNRILRMWNWAERFSHHSDLLRPASWEARVHTPHNTCNASCVCGLVHKRALNRTESYVTLRDTATNNRKPDSQFRSRTLRIRSSRLLVFISHAIRIFHFIRTSRPSVGLCQASDGNERNEWKT